MFIKLYLATDFSWGGERNSKFQSFPLKKENLFTLSTTKENTFFLCQEGARWVAPLIPPPPPQPRSTYAFILIRAELSNKHCRHVPQVPLKKGTPKAPPPPKKIKKLNETNLNSLWSNQWSLDTHQSIADIYLHSIVKLEEMWSA